MKRLFKIPIIAALLLAPFSLAAQIPSGYVQTTATVASLANGTFGAAWTNLSSSQQLGLLGCTSTFQTTVNGNFDASGHFSVLLADTAQICPSPSTWTFTLTFSCPVGTKPGAFMVAVPVTGGGGTEDISSEINAVLPTNPCAGGGGSISNQAKSVVPLATGPTIIGAQSHINEIVNGTTTVTQNLAVQGSMISNSLQGIAQCPSTIYTDIGQCINAANSYAQVNVLDGDYSATTVISPAPGQRIRWGAGTYTLAGVNCPDSTTATVYGCNMIGAGTDKTTLMLAPGANRDLITDTNYAALAASAGCSGGTGIGCYGAFRMQISDMTLDGNKSNNSTGNALRWYGRAAIIQNVIAQNAPQDCIDSTWLGDSPFSSTSDDLETYIDNSKEEFCGSNGMTLHGPHDLYVVNNISDNTGAYNYEIETPVHFVNTNAYLGTTGACYVHGNSGTSSKAKLDGSGVICSIGSAAGWALLVNNDAQPATLSQSILASNGTSPAVTLLVPTNVIAGTITQSGSGSGVQLGNAAYGSSLNFNGIFQSNGPWFDIQKETGGASSIVATSDGTMGTTLFPTNSPSQLDTFVLPYTPTPDTSYIQLPSGTIHAAGWAPQLPLSNGVIAALDVAQTWTAQQTFQNGAVIQNGATFTGGAYVVNGWAFTWPHANAGLVTFKTYAGASSPADTCSSTSNEGVIEINSVLTAYQCTNATGSYAWNRLGGVSPSYLSYQPGFLTSVLSTTSVFTKISVSSTVDSITGSALALTCTSNPTITMYECGTSSTCASPTAIGTVTVTATGQAFVGTVSSPTITAGDYIAWATTAGVCTQLDISATAQIHAN